MKLWTNLDHVAIAFAPLSSPRLLNYIAAIFFTIDIRQVKYQRDQFPFVVTQLNFAQYSRNTMSFVYSKLVYVNNPNSLAQSFRNRRFAFLKSLLETLPKLLHILDIGGTQSFWNMVDELDDTHVTLLNLNTQEISNERFESVVGNATALEYDDNSFDVVFSNSVIEHLFTWENQVKMANESQRVGKNYFIQTPNYYFPVEPHWVFPCFQYLPVSTRVMLTRRFALGHIGRIKDKQQARNIVKEIRLLTTSDMKRLFPKAWIWKERVGPLIKSMVAWDFGKSS